MTKVKTGLENLILSPPAWLKGKKLGLLCNPASVNHQLSHAGELIEQCFTGQLKALFSPQHGFFSAKQDNMIESNHIMDPVLNIPVFSLYGETRIPTEKMLDLIDVLIIDLQDVGTRVYTFIYTMAFCLTAARYFNKKVLILDRPNPISGIMAEGNLLADDCRSFVGQYPIPMRHGLTIGELALLFNKHFEETECDLEVIPMTGWQRDMYFHDTGLPWIAPSPNLPTLSSALVYPGQVIWEGTNISEGRGTTQPFELFGAPFLNQKRILESLGGNQLPGVFLRSIEFEPTSNKWQATNCRGFQMHIIDPNIFKPYQCSLNLLRAIILNHPEHFEWKSPPYEYEFKRKPIDLIIGNIDLRKQIEQSTPIEQLEKTWQSALNQYIRLSRNYHLYS